MQRETRAFVSGVFVGAWIVVTAALLHDARSAPDCPDDSFSVRTTGEWVCVTRAVEVAR